MTYRSQQPGNTELGHGPDGADMESTLFAGITEALEMVRQKAVLPGKTGGAELAPADIRHLQTTLHQCIDHLQSLTGNRSVLIWMAGVDGKCSYFNRTWLEFTGRTLEDELGDGWIEGVHPDDIDKCYDTYKDAFSKQEPFSIEYRLRRHDAQYRWVQDDGAPRFDAEDNFLGYIGHCLDVTERKIIEKELKNREKLLQKIFDFLPVGLWFADADGKLLRGNAVGQQIWGAEPLVAPEDYGVFKARRLPSGEEVKPEDWALARTIRDGVTVLDELLEIEDFNGRKKAVLNYTAPVLDDDGKVEGAVIVNLDITSRKRAEQKLNEQLEELRRWQNVTLGREKRVLELKREVNDLLAEAGRPPRYASVEEADE